VRDHLLLLCEPFKNLKNHALEFLDINILLNYRLYLFIYFWNEFTTLRGKNLRMYIMEEMFNMNFNFLILTNYEFLALNSKVYIKP
jgi:hypothetical protein